MFTRVLSLVKIFFLLLKNHFKDFFTWTLNLVSCCVKMDSLLHTHKKGFFYFLKNV